MDVNARLRSLTRLGFAVRGLLYIVIALLVITTGRAEDPGGALEYLGEGGGKLLLIVLTAGLLAYSIWRLSDAAFDIERHGSNRKGVMQRIGAAASGIVHLLLSWQAIRLIQGVASAGDGTRDGARTALHLPGGGALVVAGGVILLGAGIVQLVNAARARFLRHLEQRVARKPWALWSGRAGYAARGCVFVISGFFLVLAGLDERASEAGGTAQALTWLKSPFDVFVAFGLLAFGAFGLIEARYRVLNEVPVEQLMHGAMSRR
ncbi:DUF1206 domain-containing protein [Sphingomonas sp. NFR04]|uniref:DUF1206 domain-containing protein n=1 Tax=Sphingomonas sp. NFR04 TaxID=1566283 RepID=UPI001587CB07|nr:DUF1206 domain-containing protein [Sphingomonas sp. NFR04]